TPPPPPPSARTPASNTRHSKDSAPASAPMPFAVARFAGEDPRSHPPRPFVPHAPPSPANGSSQTAAPSPARLSLHQSRDEPPQTASTKNDPIQSPPPPAA